MLAVLLHDIIIEVLALAHVISNGIQGLSVEAPGTCGVTFGGERMSLRWTQSFASA